MQYKNDPITVVDMSNVLRYGLMKTKSEGTQYRYATEINSQQFEVVMEDGSTFRISIEKVN